MSTRQESPGFSRGEDVKETAGTAAPVLQVADRCDRCGSQAFVRVSLVMGTLMFCSHHWSEFEAVLKPKAYDVLDERHLIPK